MAEEAPIRGGPLDGGRQEAIGKHFQSQTNNGQLAIYELKQENGASYWDFEGYVETN